MEPEVRHMQMYSPCCSTQLWHPWSFRVPRSSPSPPATVTAWTRHAKHLDDAVTPKKKLNENWPRKRWKLLLSFSLPPNSSLMGCVRHVCVRPRSSIEWDERLILFWTTAPLPRAAILINVLMGFHFHVASDLIVDPAAWDLAAGDPPPPYCSHCASRVGHHLYLFPHVSPSFLAPEQKTRRLDSICISDWFIGLFFCRKIGIFFSPHANQIYPSKNMKKGRGQGRGNTSMALKEVHFFFLFFFYKRHRKTQNTHTNACMDQFVLVTSHPTRGETTHTDTMDRSRQFQHTADFTPHLLYLSKNPCLPPEVCRSSDA